MLVSLCNKLRCIARSAVIFLNTPKRRVRTYFNYDRDLFLKHSGALNPNGRDALLSQVIMAYHVIEKGLTMPNRRLDFGHDALQNLMELISAFEETYGNDKMVSHGVGVVKAYLKLHRDSNFDFSADLAFWQSIETFSDRHVDVPVAEQLHLTREDFFANRQAQFPEFAASRHTCRHFHGIVPIDVIKNAVLLAMTAPSACNRQYVKAHCVADSQLKDAVLSMQHGSRGFGQDADKVILVTADLSGVRWIEERNDPFVNAGIFIMNLCYALHYFKVAHCILNWSVGRYADRDMHDLLKIPEKERIAAIIACGGMPEEVDIASSPRKFLDDVLVLH